MIYTKTTSIRNYYFHLIVVVPKSCPLSVIQLVAFRCICKTAKSDY